MIVISIKSHVNIIQNEPLYVVCYKQHKVVRFIYILLVFQYQLILKPQLLQKTLLLLSIPYFLFVQALINLCLPSPVQYLLGYLQHHNRQSKYIIKLFEYVIQGLYIAVFHSFYIINDWF